MPLDADQIWRKEDILTGAEIKVIIEAELRTPRSNKFDVQR
jgi:hypothetical protein